MPDTTTETDTDAVTCDHCADVVTETTTAVDGEAWCAECCATDTTTCDHCSALALRGDTYAVSVEGTSEDWCHQCYDRYAATCDRRRCTAAVGPGETTMVSGEDWCQSCVGDYAVHCADCGDVYASDDGTIRYRDGRAGYVCDSCDDDDDGIADYHSCKRRGFSIQRRAGDYPYSRRVPTSRDPNAGVLFFGLEFEIENNPRQVAQCMTRHYGELLAGCEGDGSLSDGVECVTQPATLTTWRQAVPGMRKALRGTGAKAHDTTTCGMHVHVSRDAMTPLQTLKLIRLFGADETTWSRVFRRNVCDYARSVAGKPTREIVANTSRGRYDVVSLDPDKTIEIRWPKGTIVDETVIATLETIHAAIWYCRDASLTALTFAQFAAWTQSTTWIRPEAQYAIKYWSARGVIAKLPQRRSDPPKADRTAPAEVDDADTGPDDTDYLGPAAPTLPRHFDRSSQEQLEALHPSLRPTWDDVTHVSGTQLCLEGHPLGWVYLSAMPIPTVRPPTDLAHPYFKPTRSDYETPTPRQRTTQVGLLQPSAWSRRISSSGSAASYRLWDEVAYITPAQWRALPE